MKSHQVCIFEETLNDNATINRTTVQSERWTAGKFSGHVLLLTTSTLEMSVTGASGLKQLVNMKTSHTQHTCASVQTTGNRHEYSKNEIKSSTAAQNSRRQT